jgi:hypothetical protein
MGGRKTSSAPQRAITRRVMSLGEGGFSPRPRVCRISWMNAATVSSGRSAHMRFGGFTFPLARGAREFPHRSESIIQVTAPAL